MRFASLAPADLPLLVLLPGMDGTGRFFASLRAALEGRADSVVLTYPESGDQSYESLTMALLPELPMTRPYVLVAESFAGPLAILLATKAGRAPLGLCLTATFARSPMSSLTGIIKSLLPVFTRHAPAQTLIEAILVRPGDRQLAAEAAEAARHMGMKLTLARCRSALTCDVRRELAALDMPMLYLEGLQDKLIPPSCGQLIQATARNLRRVELDRPHFVLQYDVLATVRDVLIPFLHDLC